MHLFQLHVQGMVSFKSLVPKFGAGPLYNTISVQHVEVIASISGDPGVLE